jgi:hypothetical protein
VKAGKSDGCVPQDSHTRSACGRSISPANSIVFHETDPLTQAAPTAKTQKPAAQKRSSSSVAAVPAQVKQQCHSISQPPILDVPDRTDSRGFQLHSIPEADDDNDVYGFSNDNDPGLRFQPLFPDKDGVKGFFTALSSGPAHSDSDLGDVDEDGIDEDFMKDLNNVLDSSQTDPNGSGSESELEGSDDTFLASRLPAPPVNKGSAKPSSSTTKIKSSARQLKPSYDPQTCRKCFHNYVIYIF